MTSSVIRKYALAALCGAAIIGVGQSAQAATWDIYWWCCTELVPPTTALCPAQNNVINNPAGRRVVDMMNCPGNASIVAKLHNYTRHSSAATMWSGFILGPNQTIRLISSAPGVASLTGI